MTWEVNDTRRHDAAKTKKCVDPAKAIECRVLFGCSTLCVDSAIVLCSNNEAYIPGLVWPKRPKVARTRHLNRRASINRCIKL